MRTFYADALHALRKQLPAVAEREGRLECREKAGKALRSEPPEVPRVSMDGHEHDRCEDGCAARPKNTMDLLHSSDRVEDVLEHFDAHDRADGVGLERQVMNVGDEVDVGPGLDVAAIVGRRPEKVAKICLFLLRLCWPGPDLDNGRCKVKNLYAVLDEGTNERAHRDSLIFVGEIGRAETSQIVQHRLVATLARCDSRSRGGRIGTARTQGVRRTGFCPTTGWSG